MINQLFPALQGTVDVVMTVGSLVGVFVLEYSVIEGCYMIWDRIVHGIPFIR